MIATSYFGNRGRFWGRLRRMAGRLACLARSAKAAAPPGLWRIAARRAAVAALVFTGAASARTPGDQAVSAAGLELAAALKEYEDATALAASEPERSRRLFESCIQRLESLVAAGARNGPIEYDLGNACFQAGRLGEAILHYRRAQRYMPRHDDLRANLAAARTRCLTYVPPSRSQVLLTSVFFWHGASALKSRVTAALLGNALLWSLVVVWSFTRRRGFAVAACIVAVIVLAAAASAAVQILHERRTPPGVVVASDVTVFKGPGTGYERRFEQPLQAGVEFALRERRGDWWRIRLADGNEGWIAARTGRLVVE